jgi:hypothetical protein
VTFDADGEVTGHRRQRGDDGVGQRLPGKDRHDADDAVIDNQRVAVAELRLFRVMSTRDRAAEYESRRAK